MRHYGATGLLDGPGTFVTGRQKWQAAMLLVSLALTSAITFLLILDGRL
jgi:hypothetical protein